MFYKQFSKIINILNPDFVDNFDFWLATLPRNNQQNITASVVSSRLEVSYSMAEAILNFSAQVGILDKHYLIRCPKCDLVLEAVSQSELAEILSQPLFCEECEENQIISPNDIYVAYNLILHPDASEDQITQAIEQRLAKYSDPNINFTQADSLLDRPDEFYNSFYSPSESAYKKFGDLRSKLDLDYGKNTTAKGHALEVLVLEIFNQIKYVNASNDAKSRTNQFDVTALVGLDTHLTVFRYFSPYFIIECKNEKKKPDNTYMNKLQGILDGNDAQLGIIFGRHDATTPCFDLAREQYLIHKNSNKQQIILTCSDTDLYYIIDKKVNLLKYLDYKIYQITANAPKCTFEMFFRNNL